MPISKEIGFKVWQRGPKAGGPHTHTHLKTKLPIFPLSIFHFRAPAECGERHQPGDGATRALNSPLTARGAA